MLFAHAPDRKARDLMVNSVAPIWDGNETWLVLGGLALLSAFPVAFAVIMPALYFPILLMLVGLIFRGVAFEYRDRSERMRPVWDFGFAAGSTVVGFVQGAAIGGVMLGLPVRDGQFAGDSTQWLAPFPLLTGVGLVLGYSLLGAGWLVLKNEGELRDWAYARIPWLAGGVLAVLGVAALLTLDYSEIAKGHWSDRRWGFVFPAIGALALVGLAVGTRRRHDVLPFAMTVLFVVASFATLAVMFWPYMIPYSITIASAAAPEASLSFLFYGAGLFVLPVIAVYTLRVYWLFRGKVTKGYG
jgi:cytochrome d ubiquinol oxidase subunit II